VWETQTFGGCRFKAEIQDDTGEQKKETRRRRHAPQTFALIAQRDQPEVARPFAIREKRTRTATTA
jgi:hypothetical protein